jgi:mono/diheme cytochrome c family protein
LLLANSYAAIILALSFMKITRHWPAFFIFGIAILFLAFGCATKSQTPKTNAPLTNGLPAKIAPNVTPPVTSTAPVYLPDLSHVNDALPDGVFAWDELTKATNAAADQSQAHFTFDFTNISSGNVAIVNVHPSCGCTTAQLPPLPWIIGAGTNGQIGVTVNLAGKSGTLFKTVAVSTEKGSKTISLRISILPPTVPNPLSEADRAQGMAAAKVDRQAVFKDDCATCHAAPATGKYGVQLYVAVCGVCHEAERRATMVPDLHAIKTPTNEEFWRIWIAHGKPGSLMPAFATSEGGPLNDMQIASLAAYLSETIPSQAPVPPQ